MADDCDEEFLKVIFDLLDINENKEICVSELGKVVRAFGFNPTENDLQNVIKFVDKDNSGTVNFEELKRWIISSKRQQKQEKKDGRDELRQAFAMFDKNKDGHIHPDELRQILRALGDEVSDEELKFMIDSVDTDGDGRINIDEFAALMSEPLNLKK